MSLDEFKFNEKTILKLGNIKSRYEELTVKLSDPNIVNDNNLFREFSKEMSNIEPVVDAFKKYNELLKQYEDSQEILKNEKDNELKELAKEEMDIIEKEFIELNGEIRKLLIPPDPMANKNIIVEIRAGTGGEEAALFCGDLFRMYTRYAEKKNWKVEIMDSNETGLGGFKEIVFTISGKNVYENLRYESGGHRVQRIPQTEASGRVHTSAITVAIMPEVEEADVEIKQDDLRIDVLRSGGAGGQHVNKTESAVRITHIPTGIVVKCQDDRSQHKNKASAMKVLRARIYEMEQEKLHSERSEMRKEQVGSGDRSQKVRTYNFPQNRVTDHRINMTIYNLETFMQGDIDEIIDALKINANEEKLRREE
jgi:peptide chain release factor 1